MTHPHDNTWCRATAAIYAYWRRMFGRSPAADCCMAFTWLLLALVWLIAMPFLALYALEIGLRAMNKPFVSQYRVRDIIDMHDEINRRPLAPMSGSKMSSATVSNLPRP